MGNMTNAMNMAVQPAHHSTSHIATQNSLPHDRGHQLLQLPACLPACLISLGSACAF
jgi:hypothetical protein